MPETPTTPKRTRTRRSSANSQTITLRSGGTITLSGENINPFTMSADDLSFVTELAQKLRGYNDTQMTGQAKGLPRGGPVPVASTNGLPKTN